MRFFLSLLILGIVFSACTAPPEPTPDLRATVTARVTARLAEIPTATPEPTSTPYLTFTPYPTPTPTPTATPYPTATLTLTSAPRPTATARPTSTPYPTNTPEPTATPTPRPTATPTPWPTATPTPSPTATPTPRPTATPTPLQAKKYVLGLVNEARTLHGVPPVRLGTNVAAQQHAEAMLNGNFIGHWGLDGLNHVMRYTIGGGTNYVKENTSGAVLAKGVNYRSRPMKEILSESHAGLMDSAGHRREILYKSHTVMNLGIACNKITCSIVQNFEGDNVTFDKKPTISNGKLSFAGKLKWGSTLHGVQVWYNQPPHPLTLGQLDAAGPPAVGQRPATFLQEPAPPGFYWAAKDLFPIAYKWFAGTDPYAVDPEKPRRSRSLFGSTTAMDDLILTVSQLSYERTTLVLPTVADIWQFSGSAFEIEADISEIISLRSHGPGVYTVVIFGSKAGENFHLTNYSVFVGTQAP